MPACSAYSILYTLLILCRSDHFLGQFWKEKYVDITVLWAQKHNSSSISVQYPGMRTYIIVFVGTGIKNAATIRLFDIPGYCHLLTLQLGYVRASKNIVCAVT